MFNTLVNELKDYETVLRNKYLLVKFLRGISYIRFNIAIVVKHSKYLKEMFLQALYYPSMIYEFELNQMSGKSKEQNTPLEFMITTL